MKIKINFNIEIGRVVKYFILTDLFLLVGWGLVEPVFSVFIIRRIAGANLTTVGIAVAIYWLLKSFLQIPIANRLDKSPGESDDFHFLVTSLLLAAFSAFIFTLIDKSWQLYLAQAVHAVAFAVYIPSWSGIFSRHLDKNRVAFDWSLDSTAVGVASGVSGFFGGVLTETLGFNAVFLGASLFSLIAAIALLSVPELVLPRKTTAETVPLKDHMPTG